MLQHPESVNDLSDTSSAGVDLGTCPDMPGYARPDLAEVGLPAKELPKVEPVAWLERLHQLTGEPVRRPLYASRPDFEAPRAPNRMLQTWSCCLNCERWYAARAKDLNQGKSIYCSHPCAAEHFAKIGKFAGANNPRWLGGVSNDNMRYRRRQIERWPKHEAARRLVRDSVRAGKLTKLPCEVCGDPKSNGHHEDYDKPLVVIWLCRHCHDVEHERMKRVKAA